MSIIGIRRGIGTSASSLKERGSAESVKLMTSNA